MEMSENRKDTSEIARNVLETLLDLMGVDTMVMLAAEFPFSGEEGEAGAITLDVRGDDLGILIGRRGQTLSCLQYLVRIIVGHQTQEWPPIIIDVEGYKRRRFEALQALANRIAEQVKTRGVPFALEPMPAFDRRIIHLTLSEHRDVTTQSSGEGEMRKVVIIPREQL
jgi:spoIIIJ-associated protein